MNGKSQNDRIILGLKVRQFRIENGFSFSEMKKKTGMSISYLNEIEKGKKYPRIDKIELLANALDIEFGELTSKELPSKLEPIRHLLNSNFLNELPLDLFKIELTKVIEIIANAPAQVSAFISTLVELSKNYEVQQESFYFAALRSYLELHNNYFPKLEKEVEEFVSKYGLSNSKSITAERLSDILVHQYGYNIIDDGLDDYPALKKFRSVFLPKSKKLLLNSGLSDKQKAFQLGKELGFNHLKLKERATTSSLLRASSFNEVLNHSKAIYFSVALLMNEKTFIKDIERLFLSSRWNAQAFLNIMHQYGASPEMFYHRLTNILPKAFGLDKIYFIRLVHDLKRNTFEIDRELHLDDKRHPRKNELNEHYCRRWVGLSSLNKMNREKGTDHLVAIQRSKYYGTDDEYLCIAMTRSAYPSPEKNVCVTLGLRINNKLKRQIKFLDDKSISTRVVNKTCERCAIADCSERIAAPIILEKQDKRRMIQKALDELIES